MGICEYIYFNFFLTEAYGACKKWSTLNVCQVKEKLLMITFT